MSAASSIPQEAEAPENFLSLYYNFFEEVMPSLSGNAFKVALVIYRHTVGYSRQRAQISYKMLKEATGIKGRQSLTDALKEVIASGIASVYDIVGARGIKIYAIADRFFSSLTGRLLKQKERKEAKISGLPGRLVTSDQSTVQTTGENQWSTSKTASSLPDRPLKTPKAFFQDSPQAPAKEPDCDTKDTYKENVVFKETYYEEKGTPLVPAEYYQQIEDQKEEVKFVEDTYRQAFDTLKATSPLAKELPDVRREVRRAEHEVTRQKEKLAIFELAVGFMEQDIAPKDAVDKAKALVREALPGRSA